MNPFVCIFCPANPASGRGAEKKDHAVAKPEAFKDPLDEPNPFTLPKEDIFVIREREKQAKQRVCTTSKSARFDVIFIQNDAAQFVQEREMRQKKLKIWEKIPDRSSHLKIARSVKYPVFSIFNGTG